MVIYEFVYILKQKEKKVKVHKVKFEWLPQEVTLLQYFSSCKIVICIVFSPTDIKSILK